jgi:hypothetical protein
MDSAQTETAESLPEVQARQMEQTKMKTSSITESELAIKRIPIRSFVGHRKDGLIVPFVLFPRYTRVKEPPFNWYDRGTVRCWIAQFNGVEANNPQYHDAYWNHLFNSIRYQDYLTHEQEVGIYENLPKYPNGECRANVIGLHRLIENGCLADGDDGEVFWVRVSFDPPSKNEYRAIWADSVGAATRFLAPYEAELDRKMKELGIDP